MTEAPTWPKEWRRAVFLASGNAHTVSNVLTALATVGALHAPQENLRTDTCPPRHRDDAGIGGELASLPSVGQQAQPATVEEVAMFFKKEHGWPWNEAYLSADSFISAFDVRKK